MELQPASGSIETQLEPDLYNEFANTVVTLFGETGTLKQLADDNCPRDLSDPSITMEMKNTFVVKAFNEAGLEIKPEYEGLFDRVITEHKLERKFTVATPEQQQVRQTEKSRVAVESIGRSDATRAETIKLAPVTDSSEAMARQRVEVEILAAERTVLVAEIALAGTQQKAQPKAEAPHNKSESKLIDSVVPLHEAIVVRLKDVRERRADVQKTVAAQSNSESVFAASTVPAESLESVVEPEIDEEQLAIAELVEPFEPWGFVKAVPVAELTPHNEIPGLYELFADLLVDEQTESISSESVMTEHEWLEELRKEPAEIYQDFLISLQAFAKLLSPADTAIEHDELEVAEQAVTLPVASLVAERLVELEPDAQVAVGLVLRDIIGAVHGLKVLETRGNDPEAAAEVTATLEQLCVTLFEVLFPEGYEAEQVQQFVAALLDPKFRLGANDELEPNLEHSGTHEVKRQFAQLTSTLGRVEHRLQQAIGGSALSALRRANLVLAA